MYHWVSIKILNAYGFSQLVHYSTLQKYLHVYTKTLTVALICKNK